MYPIFQLINEVSIFKYQIQISRTNIETNKYYFAKLATLRYSCLLATKITEPTRLLQLTGDRRRLWPFIWLKSTEIVTTQFATIEKGQEEVAASLET